MNKTRFRLPLLGSLLLLGFALPAHAFDLVEAWRAARDYNADFAAARSDLDAGREKATQGRALLMPQVDATANYNYTNPIAPAGQGGYDSTTYGVNLQQPLFDVSKYTGYQKGKLATQQAETSYGAAEQQLILDTSQAYFNVLLAKDTLSATSASKKTFQQQLEQAKTAFEVGTATITDTHEAQAGYDGAVAQEIKAINSLELAENNLRRITGLDPKTIQPVLDKLPLELPTPATLEAWIGIALRNSLSIKAAEQTLEIAGKNVTEKKGGHLPVISLTAGYSDTQTRAPMQQPHTRGSSIGVGITLPLFAGGGINSQVREAAAQQESAKDKLEAVRRQVREDVRRTFLGVTNGAALVRAQEQLLISAKSKVESTRLGKEVGIRTNIDLLQAEQAYYSTLTSLATAKYEYLIARLSLSQAAGQLDSEVLSKLNAVIRR